MEIEEFIKYLDSEGWYCRTENSSYIEFDYERSYSDFIYDSLIVWKDEETVSVSYNDIGWGYRNIENYEFTYDEFVEWSKN